VNVDAARTCLNVDSWTAAANLAGQVMVVH
jgi:hypothetical protein